MLVEFNEAHRQDTAPPYCMATGVGTSFREKTNMSSYGYFSITYFQLGVIAKTNTIKVNLHPFENLRIVFGIDSITSASLRNKK
jgi:hypothetical protein